MLRKREPTSPGEILQEEFLKPLGLTQKRLAEHLGCDVETVDWILSGRTSLNAETARKLGATFRTSPEFWGNAQKAVDLFWASEGFELGPQEEAELLESIREADAGELIGGDKALRELGCRGLAR